MPATIVKQDTLSNITPLRPPARNNDFTILAKARLGIDNNNNNINNNLVLLQQAKHSNGCGLRRDMDTWLEILDSQLDDNQQLPQLVRVRGTLDGSRNSKSDNDTTFAPGSIASAYSISGERPIFVVDFYERGSLRDSLDKGDFLKSTEAVTGTGNHQQTGNNSNSCWKSKIAVLKDVATALHYIQCHLPGQQLGSLSSDTIFLDANRRAYLSWHSTRSHQRDYTLGRTHSWRFLPPTTLLQLKNTLSQEQDHLTFAGELSVEQDDMYTFGILAWEIATEERPFEAIDTPVLVRPEDMAHRFSKAPPARVLDLIRQCIQADRTKRPSWCTVMTSLDELDPASLEDDTPSSLGNSTIIQESSVNNADPIVTTTSPTITTTVTLPRNPCHPTALSDDKTKVVEMMESVLDSTFYRRDLPPHLDNFTSPRGKKLFQEMIAAGTGECFFRLCTSFNTQSDPAFCGVSSLSMVLNALEIDPRRQWRGVWRWYSDEQLDCCTSVEVMKQKGITFNQFSCLARCHAKVSAKRADRTSIEQFRQDIQQVCTSDQVHMVLSFSRAALGQTGSGHFSPVGGYHAGEDKVLVLDTARFKYPPFFATVQELWESLLPVDPETGECRGYFMVSATTKQKLDIQRKRLQGLIGGVGNSGDITSTASSSSASLPSQADPSSRSPSPFPELRTSVVDLIDPAEDTGLASTDDEHRDCDCDCKK
ncbi:MAG: Phytochelatin synthase-domain-containing protein [Linnemannia gamsii]|nr:MAG: Phytochelatin synthase-domain-containing protein [Linnemannia gamsii]